MVMSCRPCLQPHLWLCKPIVFLSLSLSLFFSPPTPFYSSSWCYSLSQTFYSLYITEGNILIQLSPKVQSISSSYFLPLPASFWVGFSLHVDLLSNYRQIPSIRLGKMVIRSSSLCCLGNLFC